MSVVSIALSSLSSISALDDTPNQDRAARALTVIASLLSIMGNKSKPFAMKDPHVTCSLRSSSSSEELRKGDDLSVSMRDSDTPEESVYDESSTNTGSTGRPKESGLSNEEEIKQLSARETRAIRCWRWVVLGLIIIVGAAVAAGAYHFLSEQQESQYLAGVSPSTEKSSTANVDGGEFVDLKAASLTVSFLLLLASTLHSRQQSATRLLFTYRTCIRYVQGGR